MTTDGPHPLSLPLYLSSLAMLVLLLSVFLLGMGPPPPPTAAEREVMLWAKEVIIRTEAGKPKTHICQWDHPPVFAIIEGDMDFRYAIHQGMHLLNRVLIDTRLRGISVTAGLGEEAATSANADVRIYALSGPVFTERLRTINGIHDSSQIDALVSVRWSERMVIQSATICFNLDRLTDRQQLLHTVLEEMTQSLGLIGDSWIYPDSIFYQGQTPGAWPTTLSPRDQGLLRLFYQQMKPGMSNSALELVRPLAHLR